MFKVFFTNLGKCIIVDVFGACEYSWKNSYAIQCNKCQKWYHNKCNKISTAMFDQFATEIKTSRRIDIIATPVKKVRL